MLVYEDLNKFKIDTNLGKHFYGAATKQKNLEMFWERGRKKPYTLVLPTPTTDS